MFKICLEIENLVRTQSGFSELISLNVFTETTPSPPPHQMVLYYRTSKLVN